MAPGKLAQSQGRHTAQLTQHDDVQAREGQLVSWSEAQSALLSEQLVATAMLDSQ